MKYLLLPIHLLRFWYIESIYFFIKTWKNLLLLLEEDLAVGLMVRLLFVPLFHDSSVVGRILSFLFRVSRIFIGLFAFVFVSIFIFVAAISWLFLPAIIIFAVYYSYPILAMISWIVMVLGIGLFL